MNKEVNPTTAVILIVVVVLLIGAIGWYVMNRPKKLSYPPGFNPASPPAAVPGGPAGR